jgi:flagellar hook-basal body complex protein FliE
MKIGSQDLPAITPSAAGAPGTPGTMSGAGARPAGGAGFGEVLKDAVAEIEKVQSQSDQSVRRFAAGEDVDLHTVMLDIQKAELSFRLMLEVRNKLIDAYHEVIRMQV